MDASIDTEDVRNINQRQANEFARSLTDKIQISADIVNENTITARTKMKNRYDKRISSHEIKVGDSVMLWWPYFTKNIPRSFQPKWKGPWTVITLYDRTNCTIQNELGETKNVHLNQLKPVERRNCYPNFNNPTCTSEEARSYVSFDDFTANDNREVADHDQHNNIINHAWCNIDESNILPQRTRNS